jgi:hypothetical protein
LIQFCTGVRLYPTSIASFPNFCSLITPLTQLFFNTAAIKAKLAAQKKKKGAEED